MCVHYCALQTLRVPERVRPLSPLVVARDSEGRGTYILRDELVTLDVSLTLWLVVLSTRVAHTCR
jgi:hypothetical protein